MKRISAADFVETWREFSQAFTDREEQWLEAYKSSAAWSRLFVGTKKSVNTGSPIGDAFREKYGNELQYRTEDGSFDLLFSSAPNYQ